MASEKHTYQGKTDSKGIFQIEIPEEGQNQLYKIRIVVRISLKLSKEGQDDQEFCYLLHSLVEDVKISDKPESLVFLEYKTQLNKFKCGTSTEGIEIPVQIKEQFQKKKTEISKPVEEVLSFNKVRLSGMDYKLRGVHYANETFYMDVKDGDARKLLTFDDIMKPKIKSTSISWNMDDFREYGESISKIFNNSNSNDNENYIATFGGSVYELDHAFIATKEVAVNKSLLTKDKTVEFNNGFARICEIASDVCVDKKVDLETKYSDSPRKTVVFKGRFYILTDNEIHSYDSDFLDKKAVKLPDEIKENVEFVTANEKHFFIFKVETGIETFEGTSTEIVVYKFSDI